MVRLRGRGQGLLIIITLQRGGVSIRAQGRRAGYGRTWRKACVGGRKASIRGEFRVSGCTWT
jgi:hypothetical protein